MHSLSSTITLDCIIGFALLLLTSAFFTVQALPIQQASPSPISQFSSQQTFSLSQPSNSASPSPNSLPAVIPPSNSSNLTIGNQPLGEEPSPFPRDMSPWSNKTSMLSEREVFDHVSDQSGGGQASSSYSSGDQANSPESRRQKQKNQEQAKALNEAKPKYYPAPAALMGPAYDALQNGVELPTMPEDNDNITKQLFGRPLNREQYYQRNWLWIRCRNYIDTRFDFGGSWPGPHAKHWKKTMSKKKKCGPIINWHAEYVNGKDWGDGSVSFNYFLFCGIKQAVEAAIEQANYIALKEKRTFYIYSCPGFEHEPGYVNEAAEWQRLRHGKQPEWAPKPAKEVDG